MQFNDPAAQRAIERRRREEEERKKRFFNDKQRTIGVDLEFLEKQRREKEERRLKEQKEQEDYVKFVARMDELRGQVEQESKREIEERQKRANEYNAFMKANPNLRREFDLNDPLMLKKSSPPRTSDNDPNCGPSSIQILAGEDLGWAERVRSQQAELRNWISKIKEEKALLQRKEEYLSKVEVEYLQNLNRKLKEVEELSRSIAHEKKMEAVRYNLNQAHSERPKLVDEKFIPSEEFFAQFNTSSR